MRNFGGIVGSNLNDFKEDSKDPKVNRAFHQKMLKAYLRGNEYFIFGNKGRDPYGRLIPDIYAVIVNN